MVKHSFTIAPRRKVQVRLHFDGAVIPKINGSKKRKISLRFTQNKNTQRTYTLFKKKSEFSSVYRDFVLRHFSEKYTGSLKPRFYVLKSFIKAVIPIKQVV